MTPETKLDLEAIKAKCSAATEGPWKASCALGAASVRSEWANCAIYINVRQNGETPACVTRWHRDAEFIAAARTDVPALVAEVERLEAAVQKQAENSQANYEEGVREFDQKVAALRRAETAEVRVAELEAAAKDTLYEADLRLALEDADRDCLGCGAKLGHGEVHRDGCAIGRLRTLLAKGGDS